MLAWITLLAPLVAATIILVATMKLHRVSGYIAIAGNLVAFIAALLVFASDSLEVPTYQWLGTSGGFSVSIALMTDQLAKAMLLVVTGIALLVQIFSLGYMREDKAISRYYAGLSLFLFSMLGIVFADNLVMMFLFWELVGFSSYLMIGHWFEKPAAAEAAKKAFVVNRIGDFGFMAGILMIWMAAGSFAFTELESAAQGFAADSIFVNAAVILIFCGAIGKSAQFPLHVWLPDAMEGPTPASALIHAATMVAAGIYMMVRIDYLVAVAPVAQTVIATVGALTLLLAALMATQQDDIKKVLAYSTISQLGYMVLAVGLVASTAAMFHLFTHAFFKALLFLGAGSIITALHHEQNIWKMGGLKNKMPLTFITFIIATLAIAGMPGLSGFFSKDAILAYAFEKNQLFFWTAWFTAVLTAYYMTRLFLIVFMGKPRSESAKTASESSAVMTFPLVILAIFSIIGGYKFFIGWLYQAPGHHDHLPAWFLPLAIAAFFIGSGLAFFVYRKVEKDPVLVPLFKNKFYFDEVYGFLVSKFHDSFAKMSAWVDKWILDGLVVRGLSGLTWGTGYVLRFIQLGSLQVYALVFAIGLVIMLYLTLF